MNFLNMLNISFGMAASSLFLTDTLLAKLEKAAAGSPKNSKKRSNLSKRAGEKTSGTGKTRSDRE